MKRVFVLALLALGFSTTANAEFNYNFIQATYGQVDFDDVNVDGDNIGFDASFALTDEFPIFGGLDFADLDFSVDAQSFEAGVGYNTALTPMIDVIAQLSFQSVDVDTNFGDADDTGYGLGVGLRINATDLVEINVGLEHVDLGDGGDNTALTGAALFNVTERVSIGFVGSFDDDVTQYSVAGRWYF